LASFLHLINGWSSKCQHDGKDACKQSRTIGKQLVFGKIPHKGKIFNFAEDFIEGVALTAMVKCTLMTFNAMV